MWEILCLRFSRVEKPDRGKGNIKLNGQNIFQDGLESQNDSESAEFRRNNIGFIFQSSVIELNVLENVILPLQQGKSKKSAKKEVKICLIGQNC